MREYIETHSSPPLLEIKHRPDETTQTAPCTVLRLERDEVLLYHELTAVWNVGPITIAPPMFTLAWYRRNTPYNVYTWFAPDGEAVGSYFNVVAPDGYTLIGQALHYHDRHVDVLTLPDGTTTLLDLDELAALPTVQRIAARTVADDIVARVDSLVMCIYDRIGSIFSI
ncbi:MAG: DUF402 domain-containing protein [Spirochaetales bacterium]|nr:DUF402 domain-containing protein [Spirochaetales bacterium]